MRTILFATLAVLLAGGCRQKTESLPPPEPFFFIGDGSARPIAVDAGCGSAVKAAADEFAYWLGQITGREFAVVSEPPRDGPHILIARTSDGPGADLSDPDAFSIESEADRLLVTGSSDSAISNALFSLLRELGCRWYFPDARWWVIPRIADPYVALRTTETPDYRFARFFYGTGGAPSDWMRRNRMRRHNSGSVAHAWNARIPAATYFATHPEFFAEVAGRRQPSQLCIGNPDMRKLFIENSLAYLRKFPDQRIVSVEPNDNADFCESAESRAIGDGSPSDQVFFLANETARAVAAEFPGAYAGVLAYLNHASPPSFALEPNLYVEVTTNLRNTNLTVPEVIAAFRNKGVQVGIMDYLSIPWWQWGRLGSGALGANWVKTPDSIARYASLGVTGFTAEAADNWGLNGLTYWLIAESLWSVDADRRHLTDRFFEDLFGEAASPVRRMFEGWLLRDASRIEYVLRDAALLREAFEKSSRPDVRERIAQLGQVVAWNYLFHRLTQDCLESGASALGKDSAGINRLTKWAARISKTGMLDAASLQRFLPRAPAIGAALAAAIKSGNDPMNHYGPDGELWRSEAGKEPSWEDVLEIFDEIATFAADRNLAAPAPMEKPGTFAPMTAVFPGQTATWKKPAFPARGVAVPSAMPLMVWADAGEEVRFAWGIAQSEFAPQNAPRQRSVQWTVSRYEQPESALASGNATLRADFGSIDTGGFDPAPEVSFRAGQSGAYLVNFGDQAVRVGGPGLASRPCGIVPFLAAPGRARTFTNPVWPGVPFFTALPDGRSRVQIASWKLAQKLSIRDGGGNILLSRDTFGWDDARFVGDLTGPGILEITMGTMEVSLTGFPAVLSPTPQQTLVPR